MTVTVASFKAAFPEFKGTSADDDRLATHLAQVELRVRSDWDTWRDEVVMLELAKALTGSVAGRRGRKVDTGNGRSVYDDRLTELKRTFALSRRLGTP